jgi:hypothetical protein
VPLDAGDPIQRRPLQVSPFCPLMARGYTQLTQKTQLPKRSTNRLEAEGRGDDQYWSKC